MKIQDRIHQMMLLHSLPYTGPCDRCGSSGQGRTAVVGWVRLCPACITDFDWFITHPPEVPDTSSDTLLGTQGKEQDNHGTHPSNRT